MDNLKIQSPLVPVEPWPKMIAGEVSLGPSIHFGTNDDPGFGLSGTGSMGASLPGKSQDTRFPVLLYGRATSWLSGHQESLGVRAGMRKGIKDTENALTAGILFDGGYVFGNRGQNQTPQLETGVEAGIYFLGLGSYTALSGFSGKEGLFNSAVATVGTKLSLPSRLAD